MEYIFQCQQNSYVSNTTTLEVALSSLGKGKNSNNLQDDTYYIILSENMTIDIDNGTFVYLSKGSVITKRADTLLILFGYVATRNVMSTKKDLFYRPCSEMLLQFQGLKGRAVEL